MNKQIEVPEHEDVQDDAIVTKAFIWSGLVIGILVTAGLGAFLLLQKEDVDKEMKEASHTDLQVRAEEVEVPPSPFTEMTAASGIAFKHNNGATGRKLLPETMGGGGGVFDFDRDGDLDLLLVNSAYWPYDERSNGDVPTMALYRNDGDWKFTDVTADMKLNLPFYGMGPAFGDYDNDGDDDIFISALGINRLFRNDGDKFTEVGQNAGVAGQSTTWSTSATFFDYDNDGLLDLFVCNYVKWSQQIDESQEFTLVGVGRAYGPPKNFGGSFPYLYHNEGNGKFKDVSAEMGVQVTNRVTKVPLAKSMGVVPFDFDDDGWLDIVVANDTVQNFLFHNQAGKKFVEIGARTGIAFDSKGDARGAMGIDVAHFRNDHCVGITIGNFANEMSALYLCDDQPLLFTDAAIATGLGPPTRLALTFGMFFFDYDLDGRLDIFAANGHLEDEINKVLSSQTHAQSPQLFWNSGTKGSNEFVQVDKSKCGEDLLKKLVGRGAAYGDLDLDGDLDIIIFACGGQPRLLRNDTKLGHHWIRLNLVGKTNSNAVGAIVKVHVGDRVLARQVSSTRSYLSQCERAITFGLGKDSNVDKIVVKWPGGVTETFDGSKLSIDKAHTIREGKGK